MMQGTNTQLRPYVNNGKENVSNKWSLVISLTNLVSLRIALTEAKNLREDNDVSILIVLPELKYIPR